MTLSTISRLVLRCQAEQATPTIKAATTAWLQQVQQCQQLVDSNFADTLEKTFAHEGLLREYGWGNNRDNKKLCEGVAKHVGLGMPEATDIPVQTSS